MAELVAVAIVDLLWVAGVTITVSTATVLVSGALLLGGMALSSQQRKKAQERARQEYNAAQVDRMANVLTTVAQRELVLGRVRKGGSIFFRGSTGTNKTTLVMHIAIAAHEIDAVEAIYFNDQQVTLDADGYVQTAPYGMSRRESRSGWTPPSAGTYVEGSLYQDSESGVYVWQVDVITSYARVRWELGVAGAAADARTIELFPSEWTAAHRAQGVAKLIVELTYDETVYTSGIPAVSALVRGAKVYDPRTGLTAWSDNPALLMRHVYQHAHFGKASVSSDEDARFVAAANACDTSHAWNVAGTTDTQKLYRAGLVAYFGAPANNILDDLSQAMAGMWAFAGGELYLRAGTYTAPVLTLTEADLATVQREGEQERQDTLAISVHRERAERLNVVNVRIWDAGQAYKQAALAPLRATALITRDGEELAQELTVPAVTYAPQALHVAGVLMRDLRDPLTIEATFKMRAFPLEVFDTVQLTLARYGWSAKTFIVLARTWDPNNGTVRLTLKETAAAIFTPDASFSAHGYAQNTALPSPWNIQPPALSASAVYSGTDELLLQADGTVQTRVRVTWPALSDSSITQSGEIELEWAAVGATLVWQRQKVAGDATQAYLVGPVDGQAIVIRARARNAIAASNWCVQVAHTVLGKTEPPDDITFFALDGDTFRWQPVDDIDLAGYRIRFNYGTNSFWGSGAPLHEGLLTDSPYTMPARPAGTVTFLIKAVDTSGNESTNAALIVANLGDPDVSNILVSYPKAPTFTGTITGGAVSGGALRASNTDLFYGDDAQAFYGPDTDSFYAAGTFAQMQYAWTVTPAAAGTLVLQHTITASDYSIEYQRGSQDAFYGASADLFYGDDADPFYGEPASWQTWPGAISLSAPEEVSFRITTAGGPTQGVITVATAVLDVPDIVEELQNLVISSGGTRLPITESYRVIENVQLTVQTDGNGGVTARIEDKHPTSGPLVTVRNAAGTAVTGLLDARIKGY